jgi:hypothetical protein
VPFNDFKLSFTDDNPLNRQQLHEIVELSENRIAVTLEEPDESGITGRIYTAGGDLYATLTRPVDDITQMVDGNIVTAGVFDDRFGGPGTTVRVAMFDSRLFSPKNIEGIVDSLIFDVEGVSGSVKSSEHLHLAALAGGGFVLGFLEEVDDSSSNLNMVFLSEYGQIEFDDVLTPVSLPFDTQKASFDMIALKGGGVAVALTDSDSGATSTGVDMLFFDADGTLVNSIQASGTDAGIQAKPSLVELDNGNVLLAFEDLSGTGDTLASNTLRLAEFSVAGKQGRFVGSEGDDVLRGAAGNDRISGLGGDDDISGRNGDDRLRGGLGDDKLNGGNGRDALRGNDGSDTLNGGGGNDGLGGGDGRDVLNGGSGDDALSGGAANDRLKGGGGDDILKGGQGNDRLNGGDGEDVFQFVRGRSGDDRITDFDAADDSLMIDLRGAKAGIVEVSTARGDTLVEFGTASVLLEGVTLDESEISFLYL